MPSTWALQLERAIRGWLEGDDEAKSMAEVIDREGRAAAREAAKQMKERCATFLEMDVFGTPQGELDHLASAIRALPIEGAEGGE